MTPRESFEEGKRGKIPDHVGSPLNSGWDSNRRRGAEHSTGRAQGFPGSGEGRPS